MHELFIFGHRVTTAHHRHTTLTTSPSGMHVLVVVGSGLVVERGRPIHWQGHAFLTQTRSHVLSCKRKGERGEERREREGD